MAFMMPVVKNDWDIYKSNRSRKTSECNTASTTGRVRKISECRSELGSTSHSTTAMVKHHSVPDRITGFTTSRPRASSENFQQNRAKVPVQKSASESDKQGKEGTSWLEKLKRFMRNSKNDEDEEERCKS
ncbi:unnamed protein product [Ceutorhynchus assimilis]|uniref:Uncharacterized protein n=1 Tax=Ceutorhynchus assimilis TaxID=467358 RepID=A0A9N9MSZ1_9CUCU|nr:unnamed protein product [Ceutorhynchus assimilis]